MSGSYEVEDLSLVMFHDEAGINKDFWYDVVAI